MIRLADVVADTGQLESVPRDELPGLIGEAEALRARLWARLQSPPQAAPEVPPAVVPIGNHLLRVEEAAKRLGVSRKWMYRHAATLPFTRKLAGGTLRFDEKGLQRWQEARRP